MENVNERKEVLEGIDPGDLPHELLVFPSRLKIGSSWRGKKAMTEKLVAACFAVGTNDADSWKVRRTYDAAAIGFASKGTYEGESVRQEYEPIAQRMIAEQEELTKQAYLLAA